MAYNTTFPHLVPYATNAQPVKFAPTQDSETGDEMLEPPFVRVRDGNTAYMYVDTSPETQVSGGTNSAQWIVGSSDPLINSHLDARKIKRQALVAVKYMWSTPNVNPTNRRFIFRIEYYPFMDFVVDLPTYNYTRLLTARAPDPDIDPEDGLISHLIAAMTAALVPFYVVNGGIIPNGTAFTAVLSDGYRDLLSSTFNNSNGIFYRIALSIPGIRFIFIGGSAFVRGTFLYGLEPIPISIDPTNLANYYTVFSGGPVSYLYTRWLDITSRVLTQNAKLPLSGTDIPPNLLNRIYMSEKDQRLGTVFIELLNTPLQWLNWIRSQAITSVDIQIRDEFGELIEIPQRQNNVSWFSLVLLNEL